MMAWFVVIGEGQSSLANDVSCLSFPVQVRLRSVVQQPREMGVCAEGGLIQCKAATWKELSHYGSPHMVE